MSLALLFPGQGAQTPGFLHALPDLPSTRITFDEASATLGQNALHLDSAEALASTVATQHSLLISGVAFARFLAAEDIPIAAAAGLSVGSFAAAVAARSLTFADALRLVQRRAQLMENAFPHGSHGLAVLEGLRRPQIDTLLFGSGATLANDNSPLQFVVAGPNLILDEICSHAQSLGAHRAQRLQVAVPSHTAALQPAAEELHTLLQATPVQAPRFPLYANRTARRITSADKLREDLAGNLAAPVLWRDIMSGLESIGVTHYLEAPPGHTLANLAKANIPNARTVSASETRWDTLLREARKHA